jgi:HAD superfamily hydrolase (TIGR01456 family)
VLRVFYFRAAQLTKHCSCDVAMKRNHARLRFIAPWRRHGKSADEFYGGILRNSNPLARHRRDEQRVADTMEQAQAHAEADYAARQNTWKIKDEVDDEFRRVDATRKAFLPFGAQPGSDYWGRVAEWVEESEKMSFADPPEWVRERCGVVFDVDGVLRSTAVGSIDTIANAVAAVKHLTSHGIPTVFMTNAAGATERLTALRLSKFLEVPVDPRQVVLGTSPMHHIAKRFTGSTLVIGPTGTIDAVTELGFPSPTSCRDIMNAHPDLVPLRRMVPGARSVLAPLPAFSSVVVCSAMHSDALSEIQLIVDVLTSPNGLITGAVSSHQTVPLLFAADDMFFASIRGLSPRLGPGCYREMLHAVFESVTGDVLQILPFGKPRRVNFVEARNRFSQLSRLAGRDADSIHTIFMVGDNHDADIIGANAMGKPWQSVWVRSGLGVAAPAVRSLSQGDKEAAWLKNAVRKSPNWSFESAASFVQALSVMKEEDALQRHSQHFPPPFPIDLAEIYGLACL